MATYFLSVYSRDSFTAAEVTVEPFLPNFTISAQGINFVINSAALYSVTEARVRLFPLRISFIAASDTES